ncbi:MAG: hypothetical protein ACFBSE_16250 [Prochloraceae cyanobacterium]
MDYQLLRSFWIFLQNAEIKCLIKFLNSDKSDLVNSLVDEFEDRCGVLNLKDFIKLVSYVYLKQDLIKDVVKSLLITFLDEEENNFENYYDRLKS